MRLRKFEVKNFKGIEYALVDWEDILVLIGENNAGKSSLLQAVSYFLSGGAIKDPLLFRQHDSSSDNAIELVGYFDQLTPADLNQVAVRGRTYNGEWILKKRYWFEQGNVENEDRGGWKEQLFSYSTNDEISGWPSPDNSWANFPQHFQPLIRQLPGSPVRPNVVNREQLREVVRQQRPDLIQQGPPEWTPNPGGGGNWKSNANSIIPRAIYVRAVHEASDETNAKDATTYGKLINLIVERQLLTRPEMQRLQTALEDVLQLFRPDPDHPERQAEEIRALQDRINQGLNEVIGGHALIKTVPPVLQSLVMPNTTLVIRDPLVNVETDVGHQGHGLQRTLVMTLLQLLVEVQEQAGQSESLRPNILIVEEPELYMHPQMERRMRDVLYRLAAQQDMQVICCTHSPIFVDVANKYKSIVRLVKNEQGKITTHQFTSELFPGNNEVSEKQRLHAVARFNPTVNELFFANQVVLFEEFSAIVAFERAGELTGIFDRHPRVRRDVCMIDCSGKDNLPGFQRVLNKFNIPYRVIHDSDTGNAAAESTNVKISNEAAGNQLAKVFSIQPRDLESLLGYQAPSKEKPLRAYRRVEELHEQNALPAAFIEALTMIYFGELTEPAP
jgi:putative ATP-dependent endonuclease of the OLD family